MARTTPLAIALARRVLARSTHGVAATLLAAALFGCAPLARAAPSGTLLVLNKSDDTLSLIDLGSNETLATLATGAGPHEVAVAPDGRTAVVCNYGALQPGNSLTVVDLPARQPRRTIDLGRHTRPHGIVWLDAERVAVTSEGSGSLLVVDVGSGEIVGATPTGQKTSHMVVASPRHQRAYVANIGSGSMTVVDLQAHRVLANIATGAGAEGIAISPDESEVWVTNRGADTVSVIDAGSLEVRATVRSSAFPIRAKFTPDGRYVLISNARSGDVAVFDATSRQEVRRIPMQAGTSGRRPEDRLGGQLGSGPAPVGILVVPQNDRAYVANTNADVVSVIDLQTWQVVDRLSAGKEPDGLGYSALTLH